MTSPGAGRLRVTVVGVGNRWRGDDGAGPAVLSELASRWGGDPRVRLLEIRDDITVLLGVWDESDAIWIIDAIEPAESPGAVLEIDPARLGRGTPLGGCHGVAVADAIELGRALGRTDPDLRVFGIEAGELLHGDGLSPAVAAAVQRLAVDLDDALHRRLLTGAHDLRP